MAGLNGRRRQPPSVCEVRSGRRLQRRGRSLVPAGWRSRARLHRPRRDPSARPARR